MVNVLGRQAERQAYLTQAEEQELGRRWREAGDIKARDQLVLSHLRMVRRTAAGFAKGGHSLDDLAQEGVVGLLEAANRFDERKGNRFATYAAWWVKASIGAYVYANLSVIKVGRSRQDMALMRNMQAARHRLLRDGLPAWAVNERLADLFGVSRDKIEKMMAVLTAPVMSLDECVGEDGSPLGDLIESGDAGPEELLEAADREAAIVRDVWAAVADLGKREREILTIRMLDEDRDTLDALGAAYGISKERVRQIQAGAMRKIGKALPKATREMVGA